MTQYKLGFTCTLIATGVLLPVAGAQAGAFSTGVFDQKCYSDVPVAEPTPANINQMPVEVNADNAEATQNGKAIYRGDVQVFQGNRSLSSGYTELDQTTKDVTAKGNIFYQDGQVTLRSNDVLHSNLNTQKTTLGNAEFQVHSSPARGKADQINLDQKQQTVELQQTQFTTCPPGQESWWLKASSVKIDQNEVFGEAWNASLWVKDVPVFYSPYMTFPVKDQRKSGLLYPTFAYNSSDGMDLSTPYYWNIAPNYDMTLTPRIMTNRGNMLKTEFRYMPVANTQGTLYTEYMSSDSQASKENPNIDARWLLNVKQSTNLLDNNWRTNVDITRVDANDYNYFNDLHPPVGAVVDNQLVQSATTGYYQEQWNLSGEVRDYQILLPNAVTPHQELPRLNYNAYQQGKGYETALSSELTRFAHDSDVRPAYTGTRFHVEPGLTIPVAKAAGYNLETQFKMLYTHYEQDVPDNLDSYYVNEGFSSQTMDNSVNRALPSMRVKGGLVFDRTASWNSQLYTQTMEPEFQYLYLPYRNQNNIGLYDTTNILPDYYSLFSDRRFAGLDRISDANRLSLGLTSRIFDNESIERVRFTIGQAYNLTPQRVTLLPNDTSSTNSRSQLALEGDVHPSDPWFIKGRLLYDTQAKQTSLGSGAVEYRNAGYLGQLNYRYVSKNNVVTTAPYQQTDISQLGGVAMVPLDNNWQGIAAYYYDLKQSVTVDRQLGLRYDSCCWSIDMVLEQANKPDNLTLTSTQETRIGLQFQMKGLGSVGSGTKYRLDTQLLPYTRPFNLND